MAIIEAWWAHTDVPNYSPAIEVTNGPAGVTLKGTFQDNPQTVTEARFVLSHQRLGLGPGVRCLSMPVAALGGDVSARNGDSPVLAATPHVNLRLVLRQRVLSGAQVIADETKTVMLYDIKGDGKRAQVALAPVAFPPTIFHTPAAGDVELALTVTFDPFRNRAPRYARADVRLQLPQWGVITHVS